VRAIGCAERKLITRDDEGTFFLFWITYLAAAAAAAAAAALDR
jgi:hypothetical protein